MNPIFRHNVDTHTLTLIEKNCDDSELRRAIENLDDGIVKDTTEVDLSEAFFLRSLPDLAKFKNIKILKIERCHKLANVDAIANLPIEELLASHCTNLENPSPLLSLKLRVLDISQCTGLKDLSFLTRFAETLQSLDLHDLPYAQTAKQSLMELRRLTSLDLRGTGISDTAPFRHISHLLI